MAVRIKLAVIPEPDPKERTIIKGGQKLLANGLPYFTGAGSLDYVCGGCGYVLLGNMAVGQIQNSVFECPRCHVYNDMAAPNQIH